MDVELAAGVGSELVNENQGYKLRFSKSTLRACSVGAENAACVKVSGDSIDTANTRVVDGKIYAINHNGLLRIKRLCRLPGGGLRINSYNSQEHPDETCTAEEMNNLSLSVRFSGTRLFGVDNCTFVSIELLYS
jgi:phage repressor protein C with HTH and peptisase S24 domain